MAFSMRDADAAAEEAEVFLRARDHEGACNALEPLASGRTRFPILDRIGLRLGQSNLDVADLLAVFDYMVSRKSIGYYVIVGSGLQQRLERNMTKCLKAAAGYIKFGDSWDRCDVIAERVWGAALVTDFPKARKYLEGATKNENRWIRRAVGVAVHFFSKRKRDALHEMRELLDILALVIMESNRDAIKGIGWGLKTIGKYQPGLLTGYLETQMRRTRPSALMIRKATTYLPSSVRRRLILRAGHGNG